MKKNISILIILSLLITSCWKQEIEEKKSFKTFTAVKWIINDSNSILWTVEWKTTSPLSFKSPWRIKDIQVREWEKVKAWQILAVLWNEEASIWVKWAWDILSEIQNMWIDISSISSDTNKVKESVSKLYDERLKTMDDTLNKAKIWVEMAEKDLALAKSNLKDTQDIFSWTILSSSQKIQQAENAYNMSKNNLENSKKLLDQEKNNILKNALNALTNAYIIAKNAKDYSDTILGVTETNRNKNDSYESYLGAKDSNKKTIAENWFRAFVNSYEKTYEIYNNTIVWKTNIEEKTIDSMLLSALETLELLRDNLHQIKDMLDSSTTSSSLTDEMLNSMKTQITTIIANLEQAILYPSVLWMTWVKWSHEAIYSFNNSYDLKIKQLEDAFLIAKQDYEMAKTGKDITSSDINKNTNNLWVNIEIKEDSLKLAKIWVEETYNNIELIKQEKASKIAELNAKISEISSKSSELESKKAEVRMNENMAYNSLESWIIKAPFDWVIIKKMLDIGAVTWAWIPVFIITSTDEKLIKTYIDNSKQELKSWNHINLRSWKNWRSFTGTISYIWENKDLVSKKNYIEIKLDSKDIAIWDRLTLLVSRKREEDIIIPLKAIIRKYSEPWILINKNWTAVFKIVEILAQDEEFAAVRWVGIWEKIITEWKDNILDWEKIN